MDKSDLFLLSLLSLDEDLPAEEHRKAAHLFEISPMSPTRLQIGEAVTLICRAKGHPTPKITWSKVGIGKALKGVKKAFLP